MNTAIQIVSCFSSNLDIVTIIVKNLKPSVLHSKPTAIYFSQTGLLILRLNSAKYYTRLHNIVIFIHLFLYSHLTNVDK